MRNQVAQGHGGEPPLNKVNNSGTDPPHGHTTIQAVACGPQGACVHLPACGQRLAVCYQTLLEEKTFCSQLHRCFYQSFSLIYTQLEKMLTHLRSQALSVPPTVSSPTTSTPSALLDSTLIPSASILTQSPLPSLPPSMMTEVSGPPPSRRHQHRPISQSPMMPSSTPSILPPLHSPSLALEPSPLVQPGPVFSSPATTTLATVTAPRERSSSSGLGTIWDSSGLPQAQTAKDSPSEFSPAGNPGDHQGYSTV